MSAPVAIVTGASSGIGLETARALVARGYRTVIVCRDSAHLRVLNLPGLGHDEVAGAATGEGTPGVAELVMADLSSQRQVRAAAATILGKFPAINVLVNNAGIITRTRQLTEDGIETQLAVNHLAPFLFTNLLLGALRAGAPSRIVNVASAVESAGRIDFDDLNGTRAYDANRAYCQSKLANVLFTRALARRLDGSGVTVNAVHPGVVATKLLSDYAGRPRFLGAVDRLRYPGPADAARAIVSLATANDVSGVTGAFFIDGRPAAGSDASRDPVLQERLWQVSREMTGLEGNR